MSAPAIGSREAIRAAAERLTEAARAGVPCAPVRDLVGPTDVDAAYAVQTILRDEAVAAGRRVVGRKIGLTAPAVQRQLGVDRPDFGVLYEDMVYSSGGVVPSARLLQPKVEAEVAFELGSDLDGAVDLESVRAAVRRVLPALEIVDSRIADWRIGIVDPISDNASSGGVVLGATPVSPRSVDLRLTGCVLHHNGHVAATGAGGAVLGSPINSLVWLANTVGPLGIELKAGHVVLPGSMTRAQSVAPGDTVATTIAGVGTVTAVLGREENR